MNSTAEKAPTAEQAKPQAKIVQAKHWFPIPPGVEEGLVPYYFVQKRKERLEFPVIPKAYF